MNMRKWTIPVLTMLALRGFGLAEEAAADPMLSLSVDLADGSLVIGTPRVESIAVQTPYARMKLPLRHVRRVEIANDHETATFDMANGDRLKGVFNLAPLSLDTIFGPVTIDMVHILRITVSTGGPAAGPVLHYSFDDDEGSRVVDQSGNGHHGVAHGVTREESVNGKGIRTKSSSTYVICDSPDFSLDGWRQLTVATWVKVTSYSTYGRILNRGLEDKGGGGFALSLGGSGQDTAGFGVRLGDGKSVGASVPRFTERGVWIHLAGVYDGTTVKFYVNGEESKSSDVPDELRGAAIREEPGVDLLIGKCSTRRTWSDTHVNGVLDEVMIFDRALSRAQVRRLFDAAKPPANAG